MKRYCKCRGWSDKYQCRDGISWKADGEQYQAHPPGEWCRCLDEECCPDDLCRCAVQVSPVGTWLVIDGVAVRVNITEHLEPFRGAPEWWEVTRMRDE